MGRSLAELSQAVQRSLGDAGVPLGDIWRALNRANQEAHSKYEWPWTYGSWMLLIPAIYSTGTISVAASGTVVTGTGTAWDPTWVGRRIQLGGDNVARVVASVDSPTQLTLQQPANLSAAISNGTYTLYQAVFRMPADFMVGQDLVMVQPTLRCRIAHRPRAFVEVQSMVLNQLFTTLTMFYCDYGIDETTKLQQILLCPPATGPLTFPMVYRRRPPNLATLASETWIDPSYDEALEYMARAKLKSAYKIGGGQEDASMAASILNDMRRRIAVAQIDTNGRLGFGDSSINEGGLFIGPWIGA